MKKATTYKETFDIIDFLENNFCKWFTDFFAISTIPSNTLNQLKTENKLLFKIVKIVSKPFIWLWRKIIRPFLLIITGFYILIKNMYITFAVLFAMLYFIVIPLLAKYDMQVVHSNLDVLTYTLGISWLVIFLFSFEYNYTQKDVSRVDLIVERLKNFRADEINSIKNNIQILIKRHNGQVVFLNSAIGFLWGFATLSIISAYKKEKFGIVYELFVENSYVWISFLIAFILIRVYSKIYVQIFDISEFACNEASTRIKKKSSKPFHTHYTPLPSSSRIISVPFHLRKRLFRRKIKGRL